MGTLRVWMNGVEVALWDDARNRASRLSYISQWIGSTQSRPLSLSLPLLPDGESHQGQVVNDYFDNLLLDNVTIRNRIRDRFATRSSNTFCSDPPFQHGPRRLITPGATATLGCWPAWPDHPTG